METIRDYFSSVEKKLWLVTLFSIAAGMILTVISVLRLCSAECEEGHNWRLFGFPFEAFGMLFFIVASINHWFARNQGIYSFLQLILLSSAIGAELYFIYVQKFLIGHWCPICLSIAACLMIALIAQGFREYLFIKRFQEKAMLLKLRGITSITALFAGLLASFIGVAKYNAVEAAQTSIKEHIAFGNPNSPIETYFFTDWQCPACRKLEPHLEKIVPDIEQKSKVFFIDHVMHPASLNFIPYNLSFVIHNKPQYLKLRSMLTKISETTEEPTEKQVEEGAAKLGVAYDQLNYADIALAIKYYKRLGEKFEVEGTPTVVIINTDTKKGKKLAGNNKITAQNILHSIQQLNNLK